MKRFFIKTFWFFGNPVKKIYWFIFRPKTRGVKCIIQCQDKILFVRLDYAHKSWTLPGGGVSHNETFEQAARREAFEEVGITLGELKLVGEYVNKHQYKTDVVQSFHSKVGSFDYKIDNIEIAEARWSTKDNLPEPHKPRLEEIVAYVKI